MRDFLRSVLVGACGLPAVLLTAVPAMASTVAINDVGPQRSATPNVTAEIGYARAQVHPGDQDTMTVSLINHGPQTLDDHTSVHVTVTMPQDAQVSPNVVETIPGNAPTGSSNALPSTRSVPLTQVFVRSAPGFFDVVVPAGSFGDSTSFRTYTFTLHIPADAPQGTQLIGGGVAVALENYVGLTVLKSIVAPPPVVVVVPKTPSKPHKPAGSGGSGGKPGSPRSSAGSGTPVGFGASGAGSSEWMRRWTGTGTVTMTGTSCPGGAMSGGTSSGGASSGGTPSGGASTGAMPSGGASSGGVSSGAGQCPCPIDQHMSAPAGGGSSSGGGGPVMCVCPVNPHMSAPAGAAGGNGGHSHGGSAGTQCTTGKLAATGTAPTWPLAIGLLVLAAGVALMRITRGRNWSKP